MNDPQNEFQTIHTLWTAAITIGGGIVAFFTKRLVDTVDRKADKAELERLEEDIKSFLERQDRHHESNSARLDQIILELSGRNERGRDPARQRNR